MLHTFEAAHFKTHLEDEFKIHREKRGPIKSKLVKVTDLDTPGQGSKRSHFALLFKAHGNYNNMRQGAHIVEHNKMGKMHLLLVPVMSKHHRDKADYYEAIFT